MNSVLLLCLVAVNLPIYPSLRRLFFEDKDSFRSAIRSLLSPSFRLMRPGEELMEELKAFGFLVACATLIFGQYLLAMQFLSL